MCNILYKFKKVKSNCQRRKFYFNFGFRISNLLHTYLSKDDMYHLLLKKKKINEDTYHYTHIQVTFPFFFLSKKEKLHSLSISLSLSLSFPYVSPHLHRISLNQGVWSVSSAFLCKSILRTSHYILLNTVSLNRSRFSQQ